MGLSVLAVLASCRLAVCQCPDGSPPPCARVVATRQPGLPEPDPHRIAVLPFRVTTADSLLGEGLAELVATEFTGESGPRSVNMGTVLRAWRTAGGGLRSPLAQDRAIRLARAMGAGLYVEGSVVGLGQRLTINASVVEVPGGGAHRAAPVSGPADSLDVLLGRLTSSLLATAGVDRPADDRTRLTDSPAAMRAYLEGLAQWRASRVLPAAAAFERAIAEDSTFARAVFMRWSVGQWGAPSAGWADRVRAMRDRLSPPDRLLVEGPLGTGRPRSREEQLAARQRAADQLPESAEAQYFLGDWLYHYGASINVPDQMERARVAFERSVALDSQSTVLQHLVEVALFTQDTLLARRAWAGYDRIVGGAWDWGMAVAGLAGDAAMLSAQRRRASPIHDRPPVTYSLVDYTIPPAVVREITEISDRQVAPDNSYGAFRGWRDFGAAIVHGRPAEAGRALADAGDSPVGPGRDEAQAIAAIFADGDTAAGATAVGRLRTPAVTDSARLARGACAVALWDQARTGAATWDEGLLRARNRRCQAILEATRAVLERRGNATALMLVADSVARGLDVFDPGHEAIELARAWERLGDLPRALAMIRVRAYGFGFEFVEATRCREEGRLAALAGDRTGAIRAYRRYLALRQDAEPVLIPQRDSVQAEVARLEGRR